MLILKEMRPAYFVNAQIPRHLWGGLFCVFCVHLLISKSLRPELLRFSARLIRDVIPRSPAVPDDEESELPLASTKKQIPRPPECWRTRNDKLKLRPRKVSPF